MQQCNSSERCNSDVLIHHYNYYRKIKEIQYTFLVFKKGVSEWARMNILKSGFSEIRNFRSYSEKISAFIELHICILIIKSLSM